MLKLKVPKVNCYLVYANEPDDEYVAAFTELKREVWPQIDAPIDSYIGDRLKENVLKVPSNRRRRLAAGFETARLAIQALIDTPVNRGLAIISVNERFEVIGGSGDKVVDTQSFELAMKSLMSQLDSPGQDLLRSRRVQARTWVDSCADELTSAFFKGMFKPVAV